MLLFQKNNFLITLQLHPSAFRFQLFQPSVLEPLAPYPSTEKEHMCSKK